MEQESTRKVWQDKAYQMEIAQLLRAVESPVETGLSSADVAKRQAEYGSNALEVEKHSSLLEKFIEQFKDFMIIILLAAAAVSLFASHEWHDAVIILLVVVLNAIMGVIQEAKAEEAIDALKEMASPDARVRRNGNVETIKSHELVPGDIVLLEAGDIVPADMRLLEANSLKVEEAALTGESVPVDKDIAPITLEDAGIGDRKNMVFSSTNVTYGRAVACRGSGYRHRYGYGGRTYRQYAGSCGKDQDPFAKGSGPFGKELNHYDFGHCRSNLCGGPASGKSHYRYASGIHFLGSSCYSRGLTCHFHHHPLSGNPFYGGEKGSGAYSSGGGDSGRHPGNLLR